ncbi:MAG: glycerol-3-phosphate acyltransferase, partial [Candidatus Eremiobacteraeota bacterium]|nr:glycerol-3-phosphate acyltransferase [Candidatus Eremiobacteraeota bacterium]
NAFLALGFWGGSLVLLGDVLKGIICACMGSFFVSPELAPLMIVSCGIAGILGHNYSVFLGGKGGKGIATSLGVLIYISWIAAVVGVVIWGIIVLTTKYSSLGSITAALAMPFVLYFIHCPAEYVGFGILAALTALYKHRSNIKRLLSGRELKITDKPKDKGAVI